LDSFYVFFKFERIESNESFVLLTEMIQRDKAIVASSFIKIAEERYTGSCKSSPEKPTKRKVFFETNLLGI